MRSVRRIGACAAISGFLWTMPAFAQAPGAGTGPIVFADVSMRPALDLVAAAWTARSGKTPAITYATSAALAKQIGTGIAADVFISADVKTMDDLIKAGSINGHTRQPILGNALVLIAAAESRTTLKIIAGFDFGSAIGDGKLAVCALESCALGMQAKQALDGLKIWPSVATKLIQGDDDSAVVALVASGAAQFGIVYATDAKAKTRVKVVDIIPPSSHAPIIYPIALTKVAKMPDAARFEAFMRSGEATRILLAQGFGVLK